MNDPLMTMVYWEGYHYEKKIPILIKCRYDKDSNKYTVEITRGFQDIEEEFEAKHAPIDGYMHISDVEKSVKIANNILKRLKKEAQRKKK